MKERIQFIGRGSWSRTGAWLGGLDKGSQNIFLLADENTARLCRPLFINMLPMAEAFRLITISAGEQHKTLETCRQVWSELEAQGAGRDSILINLGGGMVCDLGGFAASVYKRGIRHIHIPTSLLAQVDAAIGGKTGVNHLGLKNQIGSFRPAIRTLIEPAFLNTLPASHLREGLAEMVKTALVCNKSFWEEIRGSLNPCEKPPDSWIRTAALLKKNICDEDPYENGRRKILNFGHTVGHAIESYYLSVNKAVTHGEAVACGMKYESLLAVRLGIMNEADGQQITDFLDRHFPGDLIPAGQEEALCSLMRHDKKNLGTQIRFALCEKPGRTVFDVPVPETEILSLLRKL
ncbi:MAG TPA: 3-dehydroquinate synthase family protein [Bacteroidales bacterium]|nr:3-dehydroquinate synthase family protein [Bacteroidales bacterium]HSA43632.1 3-dehydroquinate synthase family protein [Bacteroidales bacterium]